MASCTPEQIENLRANGLSDEQIEEVCGANSLKKNDGVRAAMAPAKAASAKPAKKAAAKSFSVKAAKKTPTKKRKAKAAAKPKTVCSERGICVRYWRWKQSPSQIGKTCGMTAAEVREVIKTTCPGV